MKLRQWYRIEAKAEGETADLFVFDVIGKSFWDDETVTAKRFIEDLGALPESVKTVRVHINSPGGDPFDATAIANALRAQSTEKGRTVEVSIEGLAASAATIISSAGDVIRIADNALLMIHNPWSFEVGDARAMRSMADALDRIRDSIVATYRWTSDLSAEEIQALMDATTWMDAAEAVEKGFATEIVEGVKAAATFAPSQLARLGTVPEAFKARIEAFTAKPAAAPPPPAPADPKAVIQACKAAGFPELAEDLLGQPLEQVQAALADKVKVRKAAETRATEIRNLCALANAADLADDYIAGGMAVPQIRSQLTTWRSRLSGAPTDNRQPGTNDTAAPSEAVARLNDAYAALNRRSEGRTS